MEVDACEPDPCQEGHDHYNDVRVRPWARIAKDLGVYLIELPEAPLLRTFMPEHGSDGEELLDRIILIEPVLNVCPDD